MANEIPASVKKQIDAAVEQALAGQKAVHEQEVVKLQRHMTATVQAIQAQREAAQNDAADWRATAVQKDEDLRAAKSSLDMMAATITNLQEKVKAYESGETDKGKK